MEPFGILNNTIEYLCEQPLEVYWIQENPMESKGTLWNPKESKLILMGIHWNHIESQKIIWKSREFYGILKNLSESLWESYGIL